MTLSVPIAALGLFFSGCVVQTEPGLRGDPGPVGDAGPPGEAGTPDDAAITALQTAVGTLQAQVSTLQAKADTLQSKVDALESKNAALQTRIDALENVTYCPRLLDQDGTIRAYKPDLSAPGVVRCTFGADQMVKVGAFWIDRYEVVLVSGDSYSNNIASPPTPGTCDGSGAPYGSAGGANPIDDYPGAFPDNGNWSLPIYACSVSGVIPSRMMTWFQAQEACTLAGKRLCTNAEWQAAVAGTPDPGISDGQGGACVTQAPAPRSTGAGTLCRSNYGAEDMIGNLVEWVADWQASPSPDAQASEDFVTWGVGYGKDGVFDVVSVAADPNSGGLYQRPTAVRRGGAFDNNPMTGENAGAFDFALHSAPSDRGPVIGVRCCVGQP